MAGACLLAMRRPAYRQRDPVSGSCVELREPSAAMQRERRKLEGRGRQYRCAAKGRSDPLCEDAVVMTAERRDRVIGSWAQINRYGGMKFTKLHHAGYADGR
ncbi:MAG: hypothetical protein WD097_02840 [Balneolales bacterium]